MMVHLECHIQVRTRNGPTLTRTIRSEYVSSFERFTQMAKAEPGFSPVGEYGSKNHIDYLRVVSRDRGLTVYAEKGFNDHIHKSAEINSPLYCAGLTMNENHPSTADGIIGNIQPSDCGPLVIVPQKFSLFFYKLDQIAHLFEQKVKAGHGIDELLQWWGHVVALHALDENFSASSISLNSKELAGRVAVAKVEREQREKVEIVSWLSIVDEISEIDSSFDLDRIPAMSEDAAVVCEAMKHKKISDAETENAIQQTRNKVLVDFMCQDSVAARAGAMSLLGVVEEENKDA